MQVKLSPPERKAVVAHAELCGTVDDKITTAVGVVSSDYDRLLRGDMQGFKAHDEFGEYWLCSCDGAIHDTREAADACCADRFRAIPDMPFGRVQGKKLTAKQLEALSVVN